MPMQNQTGYHCDCPVGFTGNQCEQEVNECESQPCLNGAHCIDLRGGFECVCQSGFKGKLCQEKLSECKECSTNGTEKCFIDMSVQRCKCKPGYTGENCELVDLFDECQLEPCLWGGKCVDLEKGFECQCPENRNGTYCEIKLDFCEGISNLLIIELKIIFDHFYFKNMDIFVKTALYVTPPIKTAPK